MSKPYKFEIIIQKKIFKTIIIRDVRKKCRASLGAKYVLNAKLKTNQIQKLN